MDNGNTIVEFSHNFSESDLDFIYVVLDVSESDASKSHVIVKGLNILESTKTIYLDKIIGSNQICVKDAEVSSIYEVSTSCNDTDEYLFNFCNTEGQIIGGITCTDIGSSYKIDGLHHSAVTEFGNAGLDIYSDADSGTISPAEHINFYADYYNVSSGLAILNANCNIWFNDTGWNNIHGLW